MNHLKRWLSWKCQRNTVDVNVTVECQSSKKPTQLTSNTENVGYKMYIFYFTDVK